MSQTWNIPVPSTASLPASREAVNDALQTLLTVNSGATAPVTTYAGMLWHDSTAKALKVRNATDTAWITVISTDGP